MVLYSTKRAGIPVNDRSEMPYRVMTDDRVRLKRCRVTTLHESVVDNGDSSPRNRNADYCHHNEPLSSHRPPPVYQYQTPPSQPLRPYFQQQNCTKTSLLHLVDGRPTGEGSAAGGSRGPYFVEATSPDGHAWSTPGVMQHTLFRVRPASSGLIMKPVVACLHAWPVSLSSTPTRCCGGESVLAGLKMSRSWSLGLFA